MQTVANTSVGRVRMISGLRERSRLAGGAPIIFAYEASGLGFGLYDELTEAGITCHVLAPTKIARSAQHRRRKTDDQDTRQILQLLRGHVLAGNPLPTVWIPDTQTRDDRELVRLRLDLAQKKNAIKLQIKTLLKRHKLARPEGTGRGWTKAFRRWLEQLTECDTLGLGVRGTLASLLRQWDFFEEELKRIEQQLVRLAESPHYLSQIHALMKLPGVGVLTALVFLTEMGDLTRFANRRQLSAYLGLVPSSHESGAQQDHKGHITGQGPSRVRHVLCQATWAMLLHHGSDYPAYERIVARNPKHKKIAVVAAMRRLAVRMWHEARDVQRAAQLKAEGTRSAERPNALQLGKGLRGFGRSARVKLNST